MNDVKIMKNLACINRCSCLVAAHSFHPSKVSNPTLPPSSRGSCASRRLGESLREWTSPGFVFGGLDIVVGILPKKKHIILWFF